MLKGTAAKVARTAQRGWVQGVARKTRDTVRSLTPVATGGTRRSIVYRTQERGGVAYGQVFSTMSDAAIESIENGRRPGAPPPPPGSLRAWLAVKGIDSRLEYVIARKIGRDGLAGHHMFARGYHSLRGLLNSQVNRLSVQMVRELNK
jgi:hypothetical protein